MTNYRRYTVTEEGKGLGEEEICCVLEFEPPSIIFKLHAKLQ